MIKSRAQQEVAHRTRSMGQHCLLLPASASCREIDIAGTWSWICAKLGSMVVVSPGSSALVARCQRNRPCSGQCIHTAVMRGATVCAPSSCLGSLRAICPDPLPSRVHVHLEGCPSLDAMDTLLDKRVCRSSLPQCSVFSMDSQQANAVTGCLPSCCVVVCCMTT
jgi:hypothetical protein